VPAGKTPHIWTKLSGFPGIPYGGAQMKYRQMLKQWAKQAEEQRELREYTLRLPRYELAKIQALREMYPGKDESELLGDLLITALHDLEAAFPYIQGPKVVAEDENGDPIYEDIGPTPRFIDLTRKYADQLESG
jgi:hypothetical protein